MPAAHWRIRGDEMKAASIMEIYKFLEQGVEELVEGKEQTVRRIPRTEKG